MIEKMRKWIAERAGAEVTVLNVLKNNGVELTGICIMEEGKTITPAIYVDDLLVQIGDGSLDVEDVVEKIVGMYKECKERDFGTGEMFTLDREYILERVEYRIVNKELNRKMLENVPHREFLDLAVIYAVRTYSNAEREESFLVKNWMIEKYGISIDELGRAAAENTSRAGFNVASMAEIFPEITGCDMESPEGAPQMYVLSNQNIINGANVMLFSQPFEELAEKCGGDLYILPSSIHEVLAIPVRPDVCVGDLKKMVEVVNCFEVSEQERLSWSVYRYSKENNEVSIAV